MGVAETKRRHEDTEMGREVNRGKAGEFTAMRRRREGEGKREGEGGREGERGTGNRGRERELLNSE